jgi:hypothetical protein
LVERTYLKEREITSTLVELKALITNITKGEGVIGFKPSMPYFPERDKL